MTQRRLPLALLGAAIGLVVAVVPSGSHVTSVAAPSPTALSVGHPLAALAIAEHPRASLGQLPPAVAGSAQTGPVGPPRWPAGSLGHVATTATVTPPAAIRGPPA